MAKQSYYTKCGREFLKNSTAVVTGYTVDLREDGTISEAYQVLKEEAYEALAECVDCPFRVEVKDGWPLVHKRWECRAGSQPPNHETTWRGSLDDKNTIQIDSLDHNLMEKIRHFCIDHPELGAAYNADCMADCRRTLSISCSSNKKGIAAKKELIEIFFSGASEESKRTVNTTCGDCLKGHVGELAGHVRCSFNGRLMNRKHESCPRFESAPSVNTVVTDEDSRAHNQREGKSKQYRIKCPYLSSIGNDFIDCNAPNARRLNTVKFDSAKACHDMVDMKCNGRFMDCEDYQKYYADPTTWDDWAVPERRTNFRICAYCCNSSGYTGLPKDIDGTTWCFCQKKQEPVERDSSPCEWFNRHPDWALPRAGSQGCLSMNVDCPCYCQHNDGCAVLIARGDVLKSMIKELYSENDINCDVYLKVSKKVLENEQQKPEICKDCDNEYEGGCYHSGGGDTCISFIKTDPGEDFDSPLTSQLAFIRKKANDIMGNYVEIGYALIDIRDKKLYKAHGYSTLIECVEAELNMKKSTAYNLMKVAEKFGDASTRRLLTEYGEYNYVQCLEMSTMTEKELSMITPNMSKREMKKLKDSNRLESEPIMDVESEAAFPNEGTLKGEVIDITDFKVIGVEASAAPPSCSDDNGENTTGGTPSETSGIRRPVLSQTTDNAIDHKLAIASSCLQYSVDVLKSIEHNIYNENDVNINNRRCIEDICDILDNLRLLSNADLNQVCFDVHVNDTDDNLVNRLAAANEKIKKLEISLKQSQDAHKSKNDMHKNEVQYLKNRIKEAENKLSAADISSSNASEMIEFDNCSTV